MEAIKDYTVDNAMTAKALVGAWKDSGGFTAKKLGRASEILRSMVNEKECTNFLSFPACLMATGLRGVLTQMVESGKFNAVITTCGTVDHDVSRHFGNYYAGSFSDDDAELHKKDIHRLGNVLINVSEHGPVVEKLCQELLPELYKEKKEWSSHELLWRVGEKLGSGLLYEAAKKKIPVILPGVTDGAFGLQLWMFWQDGHKDFQVNVLQDEQLLSEITFDAKKTGAFIIGGGISKHHTIWWNQFRGGLDYAVYVTTAQEFDGSLSGARPREAVSWSKIKEAAQYVTVDGDATVMVPLVWAGI